MAVVYGCQVNVRAGYARRRYILVSATSKDDE
jgi:hypothetical protein